MASNVLRTVFDIDGSSWNRLMTKIKGDIQSISSAPGRAMAGVLGGAGIAAGAFAARRAMGVFDEAADAYRASGLAEGRVTPGEFWEMGKREASALLPGVISGEISNIASIQRLAREKDPQAIYATRMFLGGELQDPMRAAEHMMEAYKRYEEGPLGKEMRQIFSSLSSQVARDSILGILDQVQQNARTGDLEEAIHVAIGAQMAGKKLSNWVSIDALGRGIGRAAGEVQFQAEYWQKELEEIPGEIRDGFKEIHRGLSEWERNAPVNRELREDIKQLTEDLGKVFGGQSRARDVEDGVRNAMD